MALSIGELMATIDADPSGMIRGLTEAELATAGFRRDTEGQLRRVDGSLVTTSVAAREMGRAFAAGADDAALATHGLRRNAAGDLETVAGSTGNVDDAFERMGQQMLLTSRTGSTAMRHLSSDAERHLGQRGVSGRASLASRALSALRGGLSAVGSGAAGLVGKIAPLLAQLGSAVPLIAGLVGTLESIVPAATVAATGLLAVVTVSGTLKLAMHGVGDAIKTALDPGTKPAELKAALAGLAPPARQFVLAIKGLQPEFKKLQQSVQGEFFAGLGKQITGLASAVLPTLQVQLANTGMVLNGMATGAIQAATQLGKSGTLGVALDGVTNGLYDLQDIPGQVVTALGQLAAAGAPLFGRLTSAAADAATSISGKLTAAFKSGGLSSAIDTAVGVIKQIGVVVGNVGSIIGSVFAAAGSAGGSWLGILADITGAMKTAFASPGVQAALGALFSTMRVLGETVGPLVAQALGVIAPVLAALGPPAQVLITALGDALKPIIAALGPVLLAAAKAVGALVVALSPLLGVIGDLIAQLLPILTPVLDLLTSVFLDLAGPIKEIAQVLGRALQPVIKGLITVVQDLVDQYLTIFLDLLAQFLPLIPQLVPIVIQLGESIGQILEAVAPLLPQLAAMVVMFALQLLPAILPLIPPLMQLVSWLLTLATDVIVKVVVPAMQGLIDFMGGLQKKLQPAIDAVKWLTTGIASLFEWLSDHLVGHSVIPDMINSIVAWFLGLPGKAVSAIASLPGKIASIASDAARRMVSAMSTGVTNAVNAVAWLPYKAWKALGDLGGYLKSSGQALIQGFIDGIWSKLSAVGNAVSGVLSFAKDHFPNSPAKRGPFSGSGWTFHSGVATARDWAEGVASQQDHVSRAAAALMGSASGSLGGLGAGFSGGLAGAAGGGAAGAAGGVQTIRIEVAGPEEVKRLIRTIVKRDGRGGSSSVQTVFG